MKFITLLENTTCNADLTAIHGLSLYIETPKHKILFDMGPDEGFLRNAEMLGVDLTAVDIQRYVFVCDDLGTERLGDVPHADGNIVFQNSTPLLLSGIRN